ncbi:MAG: DNA-3-methyladenine glycosylase I [Candidatus Woesearchaeota archaeon]|nr:DNA-3-methyladenine glycosylase I [Candidatus Woesearchaeota archaeon]
MRCTWAGADPLMMKYHDEEWGIPIHDDRKLFEFLILEGAQAGLSWSTVLKKRENYRAAFDGFSYERIAGYDEKKIEELMQNPGIIRNRLKIISTVNNARAFMRMRKEFGSFDSYLWSFVDGKQIKNSFRSLKDIPAKTELSDRISKDLKKRGMNFVGSTIIYAFMQAVGIVDDHTVDCFRHQISVR